MELKQILFGQSYWHRKRNKVVDLICCDFDDGASLIAEARDGNGDVLSGEIFRCEACDLEEITKEQWELLYPEDPYDQMVRTPSAGTYQAVLERDLAIAKARIAELEGAAEEHREDRAMLDFLIDLTEHEGERGWQVSLDWENNQDYPRIIDADGKEIARALPDGDCEGDPELDKPWFRAAFRKAIRAAMEALKQ